MIDTKELRGAITRHGVRILNEDEVLELIDRLEAAEADALEQARLNGMGSEREAALMAKLEEAETAWKVSDKSCYDLTEKVIPNLRDQLEAAEKDIALKERIIDSLGSELNAVAKENDALRSKNHQYEVRLRKILEEPENTMSNSKALAEVIRQARLALGVKK